LASAGNEWVSLHRNHSQAEEQGIAGTFGATNEAPMRGQYRAWADFMTLGMTASRSREG
jgi:hypothetical protein